MLIYILYWVDYQGQEIFMGAFSSTEKAEERIAQHQDESRLNFRIEEETVDGRL